MDLTRLPNDKKLELCKWYFKGVSYYTVTGLWRSDRLSLHVEYCYISIVTKRQADDDESLKTTLTMIKLGCLLLPFVWGVNAIWFFKEAFMKPPYEEQKQIKKYVLMSAAGAIAWMAVFAVWITIFQLQRVSWGSTGDALSFIVPLGRA